MKKIFEPVLVICGLCLLASFFLSLSRLVSMATEGKPYEGRYCAPLMIDQAEPFLSTRWFCHSEKP